MPSCEVEMLRNTREDFLETFLTVNILDEILMNCATIQEIWRHRGRF